MLQSFFSFFQMLGVNPVWPSITILLSVVCYGLNEKKLKYKIEEKTKKDGEKEYKVYRYR